MTSDAAGMKPAASQLHAGWARREWKLPCLATPTPCKPTPSYRWA